MSSHNSAISSRTDLNPVVSSQSLYIATGVGRLCCTHLLIHYNAGLPNPCIIVFGKPGVCLFLVAPSFFAFASTDSPVAFQPHFRAHFNDAMFAYENFLWDCSLPIALVYTSFISRSIFLALNTTMESHNNPPPVYGVGLATHESSIYIEQAGINLTNISFQQLVELCETQS